MDFLLTRATAKHPCTCFLCTHPWIETVPDLIMNYNNYDSAQTKDIEKKNKNKKDVSNSHTQKKRPKQTETMTERQRQSDRQTDSQTNRDSMIITSELRMCVAKDQIQRS